MLICYGHVDREAIKAAYGVADNVGLHRINGKPEISLLGSAAVRNRVDCREICRVLNDDGGPLRACAVPG